MKALSRPTPRPGHRSQAGQSRRPHGGRLGEIASAVGRNAEVYVDGGIRRGTDILKALALGARAVLVGRPPLWGLAVGGAAGVQAVMEHLRDELVRAMQLTGTATLKDATPDLVTA